VIFVAPNRSGEFPFAIRVTDRQVFAVAEPDQIQAAIRGLQHWLSVEQRAGREAVWLPETTLQRLRDLPTRLAASAPASAAVETTAPVEAASAVTTTAPATELPTTKSREQSTMTTAAGDQQKRDQLNALARQAKRDPESRELGTLRDIMVFATGNPDAELMFVGEAPGYEEEKQKKPFVGPAGQLLTKIIEAMGLSRDDVYISNIVKFRPMIDDGSKQGRSNRKPTIIEMAACVKYLRAEIDVVQPKVIVALGGTAAQGLLGLQDSIGKIRNQFHDLDGTPVMVTYHPSYLLYREKEGPAAVKAEKRKVWDDMQMVLAKLGQAH
jgi:DNA polymerase